MNQLRQRHLLLSDEEALAYSSNLFDNTSVLSTCVRARIAWWREAATSCRNSRVLASSMPLVLENFLQKFPTWKNKKKDCWLLLPAYGGEVWCVLLSGEDKTHLLCFIFLFLRSLALYHIPYSSFWETLHWQKSTIFYKKKLTKLYIATLVQSKLLNTKLFGCYNNRKPENYPENPFQFHILRPEQGYSPSCKRW
jgi:hypothetical protein